MEILTRQMKFSTEGQGQLLDLTREVGEELGSSGLREGQVTVFVVGSTAGVSTIEFEPGLKKDMARFFEKIAPRNERYAHHDTWGDDNGSSHVRAALQGPSLTVPFSESRLLLGQWQQIVLMEFDTRPRERTVILQFIGR